MNIVNPAGAIIWTGLRDANEVIRNQLSPWPVWHQPLITVRSVPFTGPDIPPDWVLWTSPRAVDVVMSQWACLPTTRHAALGLQEKARLTAYWVETSWLSTKATGVSAAEGLAAQAGGQTIWWPCGQRANPAIPVILTAAGCRLIQTVVYDTQAHALTANERKALINSVAWVFVSPSAFESALAQVADLLTGKPLFSMSGLTKQMIEESSVAGQLYTGSDLTHLTSLIREVLG